MALTHFSIEKNTLKQGISTYRNLSLHNNIPGNVEKREMITR